jgi:hypothetical protein
MAIMACLLKASAGSQTVPGLRSFIIAQDSGNCERWLAAPEHRPQLPGMTYFNRSDAGAHEVAMAVNTERFFQEYFGATTGEYRGSEISKESG